MLIFVRVVAGCLVLSNDFLNYIPFLVFNEINVLNIAVDVGFVVGITAAITPIGSAIFLIPYAVSSSIIPQVFSFLYLLYIYSDA